MGEAVANRARQRRPPGRRRCRDGFGEAPRGRAPLRSRGSRSCRRADLFPGAGAAAPNRRRGSSRRRRHSAAAGPAFPRAPAGLRQARPRRRHRPRAMGTRRSAAGAGCRSPHPDPSSPGRNRRPGAAAPTPRRAPSAAPWLAAWVHRSRKDGRRPARHCRRPPPPAGRRRSRRSPPRCSRRSRAGRARLRSRSEKRRRGARPLHGRRRAGCGRGRNSRAPARLAAPRRARRRPAPKCRASVPQIGQNRGRPRRPSSAAA